MWSAAWCCWNQGGCCCRSTRAMRTEYLGNYAGAEGTTHQQRQHPLAAGVAGCAAVLPGGLNCLAMQHGYHACHHMTAASCLKL
jgi:hypothetical protein